MKNYVVLFSIGLLLMSGMALSFYISVQEDCTLSSIKQRNERLERYSVGDYPLIGAESEQESSRCSVDEKERMF